MIDESYRQFVQAMAIPEGRVTPNGGLLIPAPEIFARDKRIICLPLSCRNSPAFFQTTLDRTTPDLVERCWARVDKYFSLWQSFRLTFGRPGNRGESV